MMKTKPRTVLRRLVEAEQSLRQLRHLCETTARAGKLVRSMQAYKNALDTEESILAFLEEVSEIRYPRRSALQANEETESIPVIIVVNSRNAEQNRTRTKRARRIPGIATNGYLL